MYWTQPSILRVCQAKRLLKWVGLPAIGCWKISRRGWSFGEHLMFVAESGRTNSMVLGVLQSNDGHPLTTSLELPVYHIDRYDAAYCIGHDNAFLAAL